jgi:hypothetical protein
MRHPRCARGFGVTRRSWEQRGSYRRGPIDSASNRWEPFAPGRPVPTYASGARILWTGTLGPVAATASNLTAMSYDDRLGPVVARVGGPADQPPGG